MDTYEITARIRAALRVRAQTARQILIEEVWSAGAHVDAMSFSLSSSAPLWIQGYEIKAARGDWQKELREPEKAAAGMCACNQWWLATVPGIAKLEEVPPAWGVLMLDGNTFRELREASVLAPVIEARGDALFAAVLRRVNVTLEAHEAVAAGAAHAARRALNPTTAALAQAAAAVRKARDRRGR